MIIKDKMKVNIGEGMELKQYKGKTTILITDPKTGDVRQKVEHENRFTLAVPQLINKMPYALGSAYNVNTAVVGAQPQMFPLCHGGLGGLLLYPSKINDAQSDPDPLYCTDQIPTGYASQEAYSGEDNKRGNFNANESVPIDSGAGYRFVYDFSTSQANGTTNCVCLTSSDGGKSEFGESVELNYLRRITGSGYKPVLFTETGFYHVIRTSTTVELWFITLGAENLGINDGYPLTFSMAQADIGLDPTTERYKQNKGVLVHTFEGLSANVSWCGTGDEIIIVTGPSNGAISVIKYDVSTDTESAAQSIDLQTLGLYAAQQANDHGIAYDGENLYLLGNSANNNQRRNLIRVNLTTPADCELIALNLTRDEYVMGWQGSYVSGRYFLYFPSKNKKVIIRSSVLDSAAFAIGSVGVFNIYSNDQSNAVFLAGLCTPFLGTINNLSSPVTKTANDAMKVIYEVTPAEE